MVKNPLISLFEITGTFTPTELTADLESLEFLEKATQALNSAKKEISYGESINEVLLTLGNRLNEEDRSLAIIEIWHFECGLELFQKAIRNFERAKKRGLSKNVQKEVEIQIRDCRKQLTIAGRRKKSAEELFKSICDFGS